MYPPPILLICNKCALHPLCFLWQQDASRPLEVVSAADARFSSRVELSVRFGKTLLVLECDGVEPMLYPLARKDLVHQGPRYVVQVGDKVSRNPDTFYVYRNKINNIMCVEVMVCWYQRLASCLVVSLGRTRPTVAVWRRSNGVDACP